MTRVEENQKVCEQWDNLNFTGSAEQVKIKMMGSQINFLEDISKSLAQIADLQFITFTSTNPLAALFPPVNIRKEEQTEDNNGK